MNYCNIKKIKKLKKIFYFNILKKNILKNNINPASIDLYKLSRAFELDFKDNLEASSLLSSIVASPSCPHFFIAINTHSSLISRAC